MNEFEGIGPAHAEVFEVDGEPVRVHGDAPLDDKGRAAMTEVVRAARRKFLADRRSGADLERWRERIKSIERVSTRIWVGQLLGELEAERTRCDKAAEALLAEGWRPPARAIETVKDMDALQAAQDVIDAGRSGVNCWAAVIQDAHGAVYTRDVDNLQDEVDQGGHAGWWITGSGRDDIDSSTLVYPVTVLWMPEVDA